MKTIKINEDAFMILTHLKYTRSYKTYSEVITQLYEQYKNLIIEKARGQLNEK